MKEKTRTFSFLIGAGLGAIATIFLARGLGPELVRYLRIRRM